MKFVLVCPVINAICILELPLACIVKAFVLALSAWEYSVPAVAAATLYIDGVVLFEAAKETGTGLVDGFIT